MASDIPTSDLMKLGVNELRIIRDAAIKGGEHKLAQRIDQVSTEVRKIQRPDMQNCGELYEHRVGTPGITVTRSTYTGDIGAFFAPFMAPGVRFRLNRHPDRRTETVSLRNDEKLQIVKTGRR